MDRVNQLLQYSGYAVDSRNVKSGDLFFALSGERVDGHDYISEAKNRGATAAVVKNGHAVLETSLPLISVDDPLATLQDIARIKLQNHSAKIIGITGSVGKTTTKEFVATLLSERFKLSKTPKNQNGEIGLPLTILNDVCADDEVVVLEMGMDAPGQIRQLVAIAPPDVALVTTVALVHAANFSSLEAIAREKGDIFSHPKTAQKVIDSKVPVTFAGTQTFSVDMSGADYTFDAAKRVISEPSGQSPPLPFFPFLGQHNEHNFLAAAVVARLVGLSWDEIISAIPKLVLPERRLELVDINGVTYVNDTYNASAVSMTAALSAMPKPRGGGRRVAVLGDMRELGEFSEASHSQVAFLAKERVDHLFCLGDLWGLPEPISKDEALVVLKEMVRPGDVVLLKGSRVWELETLLEGMKG